MKTDDKLTSTLFDVLTKSNIPNINVPDAIRIFNNAKDIKELHEKVIENYGKELAYLTMIQPFEQTKKLKAIAGWITFMGILILLGIIATVASLSGSF